MIKLNAMAILFISFVFFCFGISFLICTIVFVHSCVIFYGSISSFT